MAHKHDVYDTDQRFVINPLTWEITNPSNRKIKLAKDDHNSERITFEIPRIVTDGHDVSLCNKIEIHYINIDAATKEKKVGVYKAKDMKIDPENAGVVIFSWLISKGCTKFAGALNFRIAFKCIDGSTLEYAKHTETFKELSVSDGESNGEAVVQDYSDVLAEWEARLLAALSDINADLDNVIATQEALMTEKLAYRLSADGTYYICEGIGSVSGTEIIIPDEVDGIPVREIAENAFNGDTRITNVIIGRNIDTIGAEAFLGCTNIAEIVLHREAYYKDEVSWWYRHHTESCNLPDAPTALAEHLTIKSVCGCYTGDDIYTTDAAFWTGAC